MPTPPYGRATAPWVRFCHILHSTHHSARSRRTRAVSDSTASSGRNSASSRSPALVLGCPFLSFSSTFRSRHQSLYLSSMVGYSNPEIQICKSAKDTRGATLNFGRRHSSSLHFQMASRLSTCFPGRGSFRHGERWTLDVLLRFALTSCGEHQNVEG